MMALILIAILVCHHVLCLKLTHNKSVDLKCSHATVTFFKPGFARLQCSCLSYCNSVYYVYVHRLWSRLEGEILAQVNSLSLTLSLYHLPSCWQSQAALVQRASTNRGITFTSPVKTDSFCVWVVDIFWDHGRDFFVSHLHRPHLLYRLLLFSK